MKLIYEGKAKRVYELNPDELLLEFKDELTAFDGAKRDHAPMKGVYAAALSAYLFAYLEENGVETHLLEYDGDRRLRVLKLEMIPLEVIVRNYAYGSQLKRMPLLKPLKRFSKPIVEFHYKRDELKDPLVLPEDILEAGILTENELKQIVNLALRINDLLMKLFEKHGLTLVDLKLEFGKRDGRIVLGDELSGDTMRLLDKEGRHLDKEAYRRGAAPSELVENYRKILEILNVKIEPIKVEKKVA